MTGRTRFKADRTVAVLTATLLGALFLAQEQDTWKIQVYLGTLVIFGAMTMLSTAILLVVPDQGTPVRKAKNFAWGMGSNTAAWYIATLCLARTIGIVGYHSTTWHWYDMVGLGLSVVYWIAYWDSLWLGGEPKVPEPVDAQRAWRREQPSGDGDQLPATTYAAPPHH
jgi:hypothetical protein